MKEAEITSHLPFNATLYERSERQIRRTFGALTTCCLRGTWGWAHEIGSLNLAWGVVRTRIMHGQGDGRRSEGYLKLAMLPGGDGSFLGVHHLPKCPENAHAAPEAFKLHEWTIE